MYTAYLVHERMLPLQLERFQMVYSNVPTRIMRFACTNLAQLTTQPC